MTHVISSVPRSPLTLASRASTTCPNWRCAGVEPALEEVLSDPMVALVMARDRLTADTVRSIAAQARRSLLNG